MSDADILWVIAGLVAIFAFVIAGIVGFFAFMFSQHLSADNTFRALVAIGLEKIHDIDVKVSALVQRWIDHDRRDK